MKLTIAYLYYDLLNLCGENGNIKVLKSILKDKADIKYLTIDDKKEFEKYDLVYIGHGINENVKLALNDLKKYKNDIEKYIENNKFFISTGSSYEMFGKKIDDVEALNIFDYSSKTFEKNEVFEVNAFVDDCSSTIVGIINRTSSNDNKKNYFLSINEGIKYKNFIGTYLLGPLLVRNPEFLENLIKKLTKNPDYKLENKFAINAYNDTLARKKYKKYKD
ncbi:MAG TPA: hypothetical protein PLT36_06120 [Erysipelotrichaceae bacterium]|nr:hypothetical protein [Erysipelotrichia bacterium]HPX33062.1 hypothetical protein [Erysipelotrichaceae bacterium]HQA85721.1 hypothetical protein [Erysipelotrichaceae bacterium]